MKFYESPAFSAWCEKVCGLDLKQMGMVTMSELELFFNKVKLPPAANILDVGCCVGYISDFISKHYNAYVTGIDIDQHAIHYAKERFATNKYLGFQVMDLNDLQFESNSFDLIYWFDTLYFTRSIEDLRSALDKCIKILKPDGYLVVFWVNFSIKFEMSEPSPDNTQVGIWCNDNKIKFQFFDLTTQIRNFYHVAVQTLHDLEPQLKVEIPEHCIRMLQEFSEMAEMCEKGDESGIYRWLYIIKRRSFMYTTSGDPMYILPEDDAQLEMTLEEMEEEYTSLMRRHQDLLDAGKVTAAADLMDYITKLEALIADMEANG